MKQVALNALKECLKKVPFLQVDWIDFSELDNQADILVQGYSSAVGAFLPIAGFARHK